MIMKNCENCDNKHDGTYGSGRFCSTKCSRGFSTKAKRKEINKRVSNSLQGNKHSEELKLKISTSLKQWNIDNERNPINEITRKKIGLKNSQRKGRTILKICKICNNEKQILISSKLCSDCKEPLRLYREKCKFTFNVYDYPELFDISLIEKYGWYSPKNSKKSNLNGISRDHLFSISEGFKYNIDPNIISHPLNCKLVRHVENQRKGMNSEISIDELIYKIRTWK